MIKVGEIINGKYRVTRVLGEGGMGIVVQAHHEALDMLVAIKFMRSELVAAGGGAERFLREARALVKLKSQHAVKVHDLGVHSHMPYIVMEHLEGSDLQTILDKQGPLSAADVAKHVRQACEAIEEAHSLGICHRDLKPANLFLAQGASGRVIVKVLDFGIAKMMRPSEDKKSLQNSLTGVNILMGTIPYMSPEQLKSSKDVDARTDIWALGVVMYELVMGELPFQGRDLYEVQQAIRHEACLMPSMHSTLKSVVERCLEKNPADRYQSAVDLAVALRPVMQESLSPFAVPSRDFRKGAPNRNRALHSVNRESKTKPEMPLSLAEGLAATAEAEPTTLRMPQSPRIQDVTPIIMPPVASNSADVVTLRVQGKVAVGGTMIMRENASESVTVKHSPSDRPMPQASGPVTPRKNALADMPQQVVPVRRGVLVVKQPIQFSRRRRNGNRPCRLFLGALMTCFLVFGVAEWREYKAESAMDSTPNNQLAHNRLFLFDHFGGKTQPIFETGKRHDSPEINSSRHD